MEKATSRLSPTVWILNKAGHDYTDAERFGSVAPLTVDRVKVLNTDRVLKDLAFGISRYATEDDYLLIAGSPILAAYVLSLWFTRFSKANLLLWKANERRYVVATITHDHMSRLLDEALT